MAEYSDPGALASLSEIDPELQELLQINPLPKMDLSDVVKMRELRHKMEQDLAASTPAQAELESNVNIVMRDGFKSQVRIHRPTTPRAKSPLIVLMYGGGFVVGTNQQLTPLARSLAALLGATAVTINYRLAPEHAFPQAPHDAWDSVRWLAANAASLGADPSAGFVLGGVSAGGNLAAVTAQKWLSEKHSPELTGLWLSVPVLLNDKIVPEKYRHRYISHRQNANSPGLDASRIKWFNTCLAADPASPLWSPFNIPGAHTGLPKTYIQVAGMDPLRDDGLVYEAVLREHGVPTRLDVYPGMPHAHRSLFPKLKQSTKALTDIFKGIAWLLNTELSEKDIAAAIVPPAGA